MNWKQFMKHCQNIEIKRQHKNTMNNQSKKEEECLHPTSLQYCKGFGNTDPFSGLTCGCKCEDCHNPQEKGECKDCEKGEFGEPCFECAKKLVPPADNGWEEKFHRGFDEWIEPIWEEFNPTLDRKLLNIRGNIEEFFSQEIQSARQSERESIIGEIKEIFNKCKTDKGLSRALSNYIIHLLRERK